MAFPLSAATLEPFLSLFQMDPAVGFGQSRYFHGRVVPLERLAHSEGDITRNPRKLSHAFMVWNSRKKYDLRNSA